MLSLAVSELLDLQQTEHAAIFDGCQYPWQALSKIEEYLGNYVKHENHGRIFPGVVLEGKVFIGEGTVIEPNVYIKGPSWIGKNCEVRQGAYLRGNVMAGDHCILGNSSEFKNCILFNEAKAPHFSYVGDSILGHGAHLGAGVVLSNLKITAGNVDLIVDGNKIDTGLRKFGSVLGDFAEAGSNCILNPGSVLGRKAILYPGISWRGICAPNTIVKLQQQHTLVVRTQ